MVRNPQTTPPSTASTSPLECTDYGRVVGITTRLPSGVGQLTEDEGVGDNDGGGVSLAYHIEFGYSQDDLSLMHAVDVYGHGPQRTVVWGIDELLRWVICVFA